MSKGNSIFNVSPVYGIQGVMEFIQAQEQKKAEDTTLRHRDGQHIELLRVPEDEREVIYERTRDRESRFYHLYVDGVKVSDDLYGFGGFLRENISNDVFNKAPYVEIVKYVEEEYSDEIKKHHKERGDKYPIGKHIKRLHGVIDTATGEIVYLSENEYENHVTILGEGKGKFAHVSMGYSSYGLIYLPTKTFIYKHDSDYSRFIETETCILVKEKEEPQFGRRKLHMAVYDKETGERVQTIV